MRTAVVHLVRASNGLAPLARFLSSLSANPAGAGYDFVVVLKGFRRGVLPREYELLLSDLAHRRIFMRDTQFDIGAYYFAARRLDHETLFFVNSYSRILHSGWLTFMNAALGEPRVGVAGASGSAESVLSAYEARLASGHSETWLERLSFRRQRLLRAFPPFPNYHIRTNAFLIGRTTFLSVQPGPLRFKRDLHRFESGGGGFTQQLVAMGLEPRVVGTDGVAYRPHEWASSTTFRGARQENLLVADNRTDDYMHSDDARRTVLSHLAWGSTPAHAAPRTSSARG